LFKERLFVHLSRFCEIRYCIVRHVGFLVGAGRPAGDAWAQPQTIEEVIALLSRPVPDAEGLNRSFAFLESIAGPVAIPEPEAEIEGALFDALTIMFVDPRGAERAGSPLRMPWARRRSRSSLHFWRSSAPRTTGPKLIPLWGMKRTWSQ
jgi:hypothetical protein